MCHTNISIYPCVDGATLSSSALISIKLPDVEPSCSSIDELYTQPKIMIVFFYQLDAQILYFNTYIILLYMFRALLCSSSGGQLY